MGKPQLPVFNSSPKAVDQLSDGHVSPPASTQTPAERFDLELDELRRQLSSYQREWNELIERIKMSTHFEKAADKRDLLDWYWARFPERATDIDVEIGFYGNIQDLGQIDAVRSRVALSDLKKRIAKFKLEFRGEKWLLDIPTKKKGTRLTFTPSDKPSSATHSFWNPHLRSFEDPVLVTGSLLFSTI